MARPALPRPNTRSVIDLGDIGIREVPLVGVHNLSSAEAGLGWHVHQGLMEICYLKRGERVYCVGGRNYRFRGNQVFVTFPDERHGSGNNPHGKGVLYWMQVRLPRRGEGFLALAPREAAPLAESLRNLPRRSFRGDHRLEALFDEIRSLYHGADAPLRRLRISSCVLAWLMAIVECAEAFGAPGLTPDIAGAVEAATRDMSRAPSIAEMARSAGLSVSRFKAKFKEQLGMPPGEYVLRRRIDAARAMLERGETSVTEVAYALGFSSSQYFATVFKRFTRARPRDVSARGVARAGGGRVARGVRHRYAADAAGRDGRR